MTTSHPSSAPVPAPVCPACGTPRTAEAPDGLCPACLMRGAMQPTAGGPLTSESGGGFWGPAGADPDAGVPPLAEVAAAFPQWEVLELIGRGGMGAVYKIRQPKLNRMAALKIIPAAPAERDPAFAGRFEREGELLARLHHPNIVTVHDSGRSGEFYYLLMEHVDGVNLRQAMRANRFTPQQALAVVPKICEALQYAHEEGVLHRDIKPENILLDSKGRVKLADFGIAKLLPAAASAAKPEDLSDQTDQTDQAHSAAADPAATTPATLTKAHAALGTPRYMAPEQAERPREVDHRADIYSLGVVFYELLTGQLPTPGAFAPPSAYAAVDHRVDGIVRQALERERDRRQRSAGEMKTQVETLTHPTASISAAAADRTGNHPGYTPEEISAAVATLRRSFEYKSRRTLFGLPLLHVAHGYDPVTRKPKAARGIFAFGGTARGVFAFGGRAHGVFAFGGLATGVVAFGGAAAGVFALGGLSLGALIALGGMAVGTFASGGMAVGWICEGGMALGWNATGGMVYAHLGHGGKVIAPHVIQANESLPGSLRLIKGLSNIVPFTGVLMLPAILATVLVPVWARRQLANRTPHGRNDPDLPADHLQSPSLPPRNGKTLTFTLLLHAGLLAIFCLVLSGMLNHSGVLLAEFGVVPSELARAIVNMNAGLGALLFPLLMLPDAAACLLALHLAGRRGLRWWTAAVVSGMLAMLLLSMTLVAEPIQRLVNNLVQVRAQEAARVQPAPLPASSTNPPASVERAASVQAPAVAPSSTAILEIPEARRFHDLAKARYESGVGTQLEVIDARRDLELAEAQAASPPDKTRAVKATLAWAKDRFDLIQARHQAGIANQTEVLDARHTLALAEAEAANDPASAARADLDWAKTKLDLLNAQWQAGMVNQTEVEKARAELRRAEAKAKAPAAENTPPTATPAPPQ